MFKLSEKNLSTERRLYVLLFLAANLAAYILPSIFTNLFALVLLPWTFGLLHTLFLRRSVRRGAETLFIAGGAGLYLLSALCNGDYGWTYLRTLWVLLAYATAVFFVPNDSCEADCRRELSTVMTLFLCACLPFMLLGLTSVFTGKLVYIPFVDMPVGIQTEGLVDDRLWILRHPNITGRAAVYCILFAIYFLETRRKALTRVLCAAAIFIAFLALAHAQSRGTNIMLAFALAMLSFFAILNRMKGSRWRFAAALTAAAAIGFGTLQAIDLVLRLDIAIARRLVPDATLAFGGATRSSQQGAFDVASTGRGDIWISALKYLRSHPKILLFGLGADSMEIMRESYPVLIEHANLHNTLLECLIDAGLPFTLCVVGFLCTLVRPSVRLMTLPSAPENRGLNILPVMIASTFVAGLVESTLFNSLALANMLFFLFSGHILRLSDTRSQNI